MTPRLLGVLLLCVGTANLALAVVMLWRSSSTFMVLATMLAISGAVLMGAGVIIGRRTHWK